LVLGKGLYIKKYQVYSPKLPLSFDGFRFIFISDLHGKKYGKNNTKLLEMIYKAKPDCILIGGDMVVGGISRRCKEGYRPLSKETVNTSIDLIAELTSKYTVIHALGNHEEKLHPALWEEYKSKLKELNVKLLDNEKFSFHRENDDYIRAHPPKNSGRERYGSKFLDSIIKEGERLSVADEDLLATITDYTAFTIYYSIKNHCKLTPDRLIVGGGGANNHTLMSYIRKYLPDTEVITNEDLGLSGDAKEAVAFALLANDCIYGVPNNAPKATGAIHPVIMGKITR